METTETSEARCGNEEPKVLSALELQEQQWLDEYRAYRQEICTQLKADLARIAKQHQELGEGILRKKALLESEVERRDSFYHHFEEKLRALQQNPGLEHVGLLIKDLLGDEELKEKMFAMLKKAEGEYLDKMGKRNPFSASRQWNSLQEVRVDLLGYEQDVGFLRSLGLQDRANDKKILAHMRLWQHYLEAPFFNTTLAQYVTWVDGYAKREVRELELRLQQCESERRNSDEKLQEERNAALRGASSNISAMLEGVSKEIDTLRHRCLNDLEKNILIAFDAHDGTRTEVLERLAKESLDVVEPALSHLVELDILEEKTARIFRLCFLPPLKDEHDESAQLGSFQSSPLLHEPLALPDHRRYAIQAVLANDTIAERLLGSQKGLAKLAPEQFDLYVQTLSNIVDILVHYPQESNSITGIEDRVVKHAGSLPEAVDFFTQLKKTLNSLQSSDEQHVWEALSKERFEPDVTRAVILAFKPSTLAFFGGNYIPYEHIRKNCRPYLDPEKMDGLHEAVMSYTKEGLLLSFFSDTAFSLTIKPGQIRKESLQQAYRYYAKAKNV